MRRDVAVSINYPRHCMLLAAVSVVLFLTQRWCTVLGPVPSLGLYGALHSSVLVAAVRPPPTAWRKVAFIAGASGLAMLSVATARCASQVFASTPGMGLPAVLLTLLSGLGAASYGLLIRRFWIRDLSRLAPAWITLCCVVSTLVALPLGAYLHAIGGCWFAVIWWWAFSLALWYHEGRAYGIEVPHVWHS